jgi:hypothetical protein
MSDGIMVECGAIVKTTGRETFVVRKPGSLCRIAIPSGCRLVALIETVPEGDYLLIENVAVLPAFQGRGFDIRLLRLAEELAESSELRGARLYTNKLFADNLRLYTSSGHQIEREEDLNGRVAVHMLKARAMRQKSNPLLLSTYSQSGQYVLSYAKRKADAVVQKLTISGTRSITSSPRRG